MRYPGSRIVASYRESLALVHRIHALPAGMAPPAAFAFASSEPEIAPNQKESEIVWS